jgi:DNA repair protein RadC
MSIINQTLKDVNYILPVQKCQMGEDVKNLSDLELLAVVLGSGTKKMDVLDLASALLKKFGGLAGLRQSGLREISGINGIGMTKSVRIHSAFELGSRSMKKNDKTVVLDSPEAVWKFLLPETGVLKKEEFRSLVMNNKNVLLKKIVVSVGTINEAIIHPREVFVDAIKEGGSGIIAVHNHPSGSTKPSKEDIETTMRMVEAGKIIGIPLIDHIIVTSTSYESLRESGIIH